MTPAGNGIEEKEPTRQNGGPKRHPRRHKSEHAAIELEPDLPGHDPVQFCEQLLLTRGNEAPGCQVVGKDEVGGIG